MTSNILHSCDESDDSLRITSVEVEVEANVYNDMNDNSNVPFYFCNFVTYTTKPQGLVTIHVNILSMYKHVQGPTPFLPPLASTRVCILNSF